MKKIMFVMAVILLLNLGIANAITKEEINEAKSLIDSKADCKSLSDHRLEIMGEYYMEQMHPGESHELMHKMMGLKEGSEAEEQFHINMAKAIYCGETNAFGSGGMMGGGMMNMMMGMQNPMQTNLPQGMMGNWGYGLGYWDFLNVLYAILLIGLIILVYLGIIKLWKNTKNKGGKK
jgi:hypothetical protein